MELLEIDTGDTAWVLIAATLVFFMTPGLAFFYGGMVKAKSVLNMLMMSMVTIGIVAVLWVLYGYSIAFGNDVGLGLLGNPMEYLGLTSLLGAGAESGTIPTLAFVGFQGAFAVIATALISGAVADRMRFGAWAVFAALWATLVYFPAAHWVFAFDGDGYTGGFIANQIGAIDFAGGTAIHINAGIAALALVLVLGNRIDFRRRPTRPHNLTLVMLGAGILWFGWFGFNAGSAVAAGELAGLAWVNTLVGAAAAMIAWLIVERLRDGHATSLGAASGIVAGLVGITPACANVSPVGAIIIGAAAGVACAFAIGLKNKLGYDDSLDVVGVHLVGGLIGTLLIGFLADPMGDPEGAAGLFYGGGLGQLWAQFLGAAAVLVYSFVVTFIIAKALSLVMKLRVSESAEAEGIDVTQHAETGYDLSSVGYSTYTVRQTLLVPAREDASK
ncbi:MAG: ammonium transporter [Arachnia sp.]